MLVLRKELRMSRHQSELTDEQLAHIALLLPVPKDSPKGPKITDSSSSAPVVNASDPRPSP